MLRIISCVLVVCDDAAKLRSSASVSVDVASWHGCTMTPPVLWFVLLHRPAALAESVFDGVKAKMRNMRAALATKDNMLQALAQVSITAGSLPKLGNSACVQAVFQPTVQSTAAE